MSEHGEGLATPESPVGGPGPEIRVGLLKRPWTSDALYWVAVVLLGLLGIAGVRSAVRQTSGPLGVSGLWWIEIVTLVITTGIMFLLVLLIPAWIRQAVRRSRRRKALASTPPTADPGWQPDPLDPSRYRWWNGSSWDDVVAPSTPDRPAGVIAVLVLGAVLVGPTVAFGVWGVAASAGRTTPVTSDVAEKNPNTALAVETALTNLLTSTEAFLKTPVDPDDLEASTRASASKLPAVESDYEYFHTVVNAVSTQDELGPGAPSLSSLRQLDTDMGTWLATRQQYLAALEPCLGAPTNLDYATCADPVYTRFATPLQDTSVTTGKSFQAVLDGIGKQ